MKTGLIKRLEWAPYVFFGLLLLSKISLPTVDVFDELYYKNDAMRMITFTESTNWVHPPLGKWIMGIGWLVFAKVLHLLNDWAAVRITAVFFGLWVLWALAQWLKALGFKPFSVQAAVWLTGFNFLWFVQSKTALLDIFYLAFALQGSLWVYEARSRKQYYRGWILLGLSMACKWAAAPYCAVFLFLLKNRIAWKVRIKGVLLSIFIYTLPFLPMAFLNTNPLSPLEIPRYHQNMLDGMKQINSSPHPYLSSWWQWPTLARPIWYTLQKVDTPTEKGERYVWAGGNPLLYWAALPLIVILLLSALRSRGRDEKATLLAILYAVPMLFWIILPRKLQMYYYYLPSSIFVGAVVVWALEKYGDRWGHKIAVLKAEENRNFLLGVFVVSCGLLFFYFMPVMDARLLPMGSFRRYMWFLSWI